MNAARAGRLTPGGEEYVVSVPCDWCGAPTGTRCTNMLNGRLLVAFPGHFIRRREAYERQAAR